MACLKCGKEAEGTFCTDCLAEMERYPVRPNTAIHLPPPNASVRRNSHKRIEKSAEEQIPGLKKRIYRLWIAVLVLCVLNVGMVVYGVLHFRSHQKPLLGQNYSTVTHPTEEPNHVTD